MFFIIHLGNLRSVKIVQKSVKSQGIFQLLMRSNPAISGVLSKLGEGCAGKRVGCGRL